MPARAFCLCAVFTTLLLASAPLRAVETCHVINAKGVGRLTSTTTTESQIIGGGLLHGTTTAELTFTGMSGDVALYEGALELTTAQGTLTLAITEGEFNVTTGEFSNNSSIISGTGRFEGATGALFFHGFVAPDGTFIDDELSGQICLTLP